MSLSRALRDLIARYEHDGIPNDSLPVVDAARKALADATAPSTQGPAELWLQLHGSEIRDGELDEPVDFTDDSVTWCWDQINSSDVRYVRADLAGMKGSGDAQP